MASPLFPLLDVPENIMPLPPRLANDAEVQRLIADERMRTEQHRMNYLVLKTEHTRLQEDYTNLENDRKRALDDMRNIQDNNKSIVEQLREEVRMKKEECEELRSQIWTPQRLEMVRMQMQEDFEKGYRERLIIAENDAETQRSLCNQLKYDFTFLKSEYEHEKQLHRQIIDEMKKKYELEVSNLRSERESLAQRQYSDNGQDAIKLKSVQRENTQLQMRVKALVEEIEDLRAQKEHSSSQCDHTTHMYTKQLAEQSASLKAFEMERDSLKSQVVTLQRELLASADSINELTSRAHELSADNTLLRNRVDEVTHRAKVDVTNVRVELMKEHSDVERSRERLRSELDDKIADIEILKQRILSLEKELDDKERECAKRVQLVREEEMLKFAQVDEEKNSLATRLQEIERRKMDDVAERQIEKERTEEAMIKMKEAKDNAEREAAVSRAKLDSQQAMLDRLDKERVENSDLIAKLSRLEIQYQQYLSSEKDLFETNELLRLEVDKLKKVLSDKQEEMAQVMEANEATLIQQRANFGEERLVLQRRIDELDSELSMLQKKIADILALHSKKKKKMAKLIVKLKNRMELQMAKISEMEIEREALRKCVPSETHGVVKKQLKDLVRRHQTFRGVILTPDPANITDLATDLSHIEHPDAKLAIIKDRMEILDGLQRKQMQELQEALRSASPKLHEKVTNNDY